jgi:hypothetical protein
MGQEERARGREAEGPVAHMRGTSGPGNMDLAAEGKADAATLESDDWKPF